MHACAACYVIPKCVLKVTFILMSDIQIVCVWMSGWLMDG